MENVILNDLGSERSVEIRFVAESLERYAGGYKIKKILDVGGQPTNIRDMKLIYDVMSKNVNQLYKVVDLRGGNYVGDFCAIDFGIEKFDFVIFLSSIEHFPQSTEGDMIYREDYDKVAFQKALSILNDDGVICLTVPFGKHLWQPFHQNYDWNGILELSKGAIIVESYTYRLENNQWVLGNPNNMNDIYYTDKAYGVGCFIFKKG